MRTTVELPADLMRAAKARSAEAGETLKELLTRAVAAELETSVDRRGPKARVALPLFGDPAATKVRLTNADVARALADADGERAATAPRRRGRRRTR